MALLNFLNPPLMHPTGWIPLPNAVIGSHGCKSFASGPGARLLTFLMTVLGVAAHVATVIRLRPVLLTDAFSGRWLVLKSPGLSIHLLPESKVCFLDALHYLYVFTTLY